jgi:hypothetical protein
MSKKSKTFDIQVCVVCENASGETELVFQGVSTTQDQYDEGEHKDTAKTVAEAKGFEPIVAFDEREPAWAAMNLAGSKAYQEFYARTVETFQSLIVGDNPVNGADLVDNLGHFLRQNVQEVMPSAGANLTLQIAMTTEGFIDQFGNVEDDVRILCSAESIDLASRRGAVLVPVSVDDVADGLPTFADLTGAAEDAIDRGKENGFAITDVNAADVIREELDLGGIESPPVSFNPLLVQVMRNVQEAEKSAQRERN